jgi:hypothetical protein
MLITNRYVVAARWGIYVVANVTKQKDWKEDGKPQVDDWVNVENGRIEPRRRNSEGVYGRV